MRFPLPALLAIAAAACGGSAPAPPGPVGNTTTASSATVGLAAIDVAEFEALAADRGWHQVIDPAVGVVVMHAVATPVDDDPGEFWVERRCGDRAVTEAELVAAAIHKRELRMPDDYALTCTPVGLLVECGQTGLAEYDLSYLFRFEHRKNLYVLTGITTVDVGTTASDEDAKFEAELAKPAGC